MPRARLAAAPVSLALLAAACGLTVSDGPGRAAPPAAVVVWPSRPLPTALIRDARGLGGVVGLGRIGASTLDLARVRGADRRLPRRPAGGVLPVSVIAVDPGPLVRTASFPEVAAPLARGEAVLTAAAAGLRAMGPGDALRLDGAGGSSAWFRVGAVIAESDPLDAEVILPLRGARALGVPSNRGLVLMVAADAVGGAVARIRSLLAGLPARIGPPGGWPPGGSPMLPLARVKQIFGEFTFRPLDGYRITIDPLWVEANIGRARLPLLGTVKCHRLVLPQLAGAMQELVARGLADLVRSVDGCWSPRMQFANHRAVSRHAFGIAVDLNYADNQYGAPPRQDPRLVEVMERWGFIWGGRWMIPDGMHFEFVRFP